ncbi:MAG: RsmB/NOP family class I SAM-dependent RNA methyltransferase [Lachnospiraceae bacterium]|nr:RsmB/NOP family class I SAM-dependent RNA methyltransferase [Lachnospiraceae bacterium]
MQNLPEEFKNRIKRLLGDAANEFFDTYVTASHTSLRINTLRLPSNKGLNILQQCSLLGEKPAQIPWEKSGFYYDENDRPGRHVLHEAGFYYIQEASAQAPVSFLDPRPGERILDLCAAPGGKSTQIGGAMKGEGILVSNEIHPSRAKILSENVERMGITNALVTRESPDRLVSFFPGYFDKILVDAPCSGEGMFRKNDEAVSEWSVENVLHCAERQLFILEQADRMLRPGGRIVYSTCTFSPEENEKLVEAFLTSHPDYHLCPMDLSGGMLSSHLDKGNLNRGKDDRMPVFDEISPARGMVRLFPHKLKGEGHFAALLEKKNRGLYTSETMPAPLPKSGSPKKLNRNSKSKKGASAPDLSTALDFLKQDPKYADIDRIFMMGDQVYLLPDARLALQGLTLVRPGLHLGTLERGRFLPSMALARALTVDDNFNYVNLSVSDPDDMDLLASYLEGATFPYMGEPGWYLICCEGLGIGWGKLAGGIMKNHYPKGLRKRLNH